MSTDEQTPSNTIINLDKWLEDRFNRQYTMGFATDIKQGVGSTLSPNLTADALDSIVASYSVVEMNKEFETYFYFFGVYAGAASEAVRSGDYPIEDQGVLQQFANAPRRLTQMIDSFLKPLGIKERSTEELFVETYGSSKDFSD